MAQTQTRSSSSKAAAPVKSATKAASATAAKKASPPKTRTAKKGNGENITAEQRYCMVAEAAYFIAEKRGFAPGDPAQDWAEAEAQIQHLLNS